MKNRKSVYFIVFISLFVGLLHFLIGPNYRGVFEEFIRGYLIDVVLPLNLYLLLQVSLRKMVSVLKARFIGAGFTFCFGVMVEILQLNKIPLFGSTYDPMDILMYGIGVGIGVLLDFTIIENFEKENMCIRNHARKSRIANFPL